MLNYNEMGILMGLFALMLIFLVQKKVKGKFLKTIWKCSLLFFILYTSILIFVEIRWYFISEHAKSFDLNQNGFVDLDEYNEEAINALNRVTQDTAKNFAFITVGMLSLAVSFSFLLVEFLMARFKIKKIQSDAQSPS
ncbi:hypothetical protein [Flagellimonas sp.]|uniref:hypothetical protein n=1 Tax=Flagellimonas sp. TaxID=2058762 RepID=UPI003B5C129D